MSKKWIGNMMLLLAAMIWGAAFTAQTEAMNYVEPFTFQAIRFFLGGIVLLPVIAVIDKRGNNKKPVTKDAKKYQLFCGIVCGLILFAACSPQQIGLMLNIPAGKSGFITSLYIILVPVFGLFVKKKVPVWVWISIVLALAGLYLLCGTGGFSLSLGEGLTLLCAIFFTFHILFIDHVSPRVDGVRLSCMQFFTCSAISLIVALVTEHPTVDSLISCWLPIAYTGIFSSGVAYTLQILGQSRTDPATASLLMSLESVFSALFGWILINQKLSPTELAGCGLVFIAVILAQMPERKKLT